MARIVLTVESQHFFDCEHGHTHRVLGIFDSTQEAIDAIPDDSDMEGDVYLLTNVETGSTARVRWAHDVQREQEQDQPEPVNFTLDHTDFDCVLEEYPGAQVTEIGDSMFRVNVHEPWCGELVQTQRVLDSFVATVRDGQAVRL